MKMLGLNPMEQDIMDLCNTVPRNGLIYFPDFCAIVLKRWREEDEEVFRQNMFKVRFILPFLRFILTDICLDLLRHRTLSRAVSRQEIQI